MDFYHGIHHHLSPPFREKILGSLFRSHHGQSQIQGIIEFLQQSGRFLVARWQKQVLLVGSATQLGTFLWDNDNLTILLVPVLGWLSDPFKVNREKLPTSTGDRRTPALLKGFFVWGVH